MNMPISLSHVAGQLRRGLTGVALLALAVWGTACSSVAPHPSAGWRPLFDGTSKAGWEMTGPGELKLENGELVTYGGMGLLWYPGEKFGNCQIRVVYKMTKADDNSGVFIRIPEKPFDPWFGVNRGYEVQIDNGGDDYHRTGCLYSLSKALGRPKTQVGEWTTMVITLNGPRTTVDVNGTRITDFKEGDVVPAKKIWHEPDRGPRPEAGYIGLQNHGGEAHVHFKEVSVKKL